MATDYQLDQQLRYGMGASYMGNSSKLELQIPHSLVILLIRVVTSLHVLSSITPYPERSMYLEIKSH